ncbi:hypothetical protein B484DRAFT_231494 [Ochromonadaceae sp. CCMP2298]|nr:hypothetical protein B484DRAFT_231494 [Ochromonadaceae sp. CCMP2298]
MLRQLREKLLMTKREMGKWTGLQEQLQERLLLVVGLVRGASIRSIVSGGDGHPESPSDGLAKGERREMSQGLSLVRSQVQQKLAQCYRGTAAARRDFLDLEGVRGDMVRLLEQCDGSIEADKLMEGAKDGAGAGKNGAGAKDEAAEEMGLRRREAVEASQEKVRGMVVQLAQVFSTMEGEVANSARASASTPVIASTSARESGQQAPTHIPFSEQVVQEHVQLDCDAACIASAKTALCPTSASAAAAGPRLDASLIAIDSASCWACVPGTYSLTLVLPTAQLVTALNLQGGFVFPGDAQTQSQTQEQTQGQAQTQAREVETIRTVKLPSGVSLSTLDPRFEITASALADVLDWSSLLKSNPPEKFLRRPPVRFLFDLVRHIAEHNAGFMGTLGDAQWAEVGTDKASKLDFMDQVVVFVTECVHSPQAVTSAGAIVTGSDPELTNLLLQQLAIALYCFQHNVDTSSVSVSASTSVSALGQAASSASSAPSGRSGPSGPGRATEAWVTSLRVELSPDGLTWVPVPSGELFTGLSAAQQVVTLSLLPAQSKDAATTSPARFVRITPLAWNGGEAFGPALRVALLRPELLSEDEAEEAGDGGGQDSEMTVRTALVVEVVDVLVGALGTLMETVAFRARSEEQRRELKKLEVKKHLETLAREKQVLEQLLASEKQSLESDNQDLSDQLKKCFSQMKETQGLLQKEQEISAELGKSRAQLEGEKSALQRALGEKEETNGRLAAEVLGLQANAEKDRREQQAVGERVQQSEGLAETLQEQLSQAEEARTADEAEREDLLGQIQILIEERDTARAEEEDLFERLGERSNDLDRLQESYVEIADRCNDHQDEAMDLRDRVEALESALSSSMQAALTPVTFATAAPVVAPVAVAPFVSVAVAAAAPARADSPTQATHGTDADATDATACAKDSPRSLSSPAKIAGCGGGVGAKARKDSKQSKPLGAGAIPQAGADSKLASPPRAPADEYAEDFDDDYADEFED